MLFGFKPFHMSERICFAHSRVAGPLRGTVGAAAPDGLANARPSFAIYAADLRPNFGYRVIGVSLTNQEVCSRTLFDAMAVCQCSLLLILQPK